MSNDIVVGDGWQVYIERACVYPEDINFPESQVFATDV